MDWEPYAERLAEQITHPVSRWRASVSAIPRHLFVPRWWQREAGAWALQDGRADPDAWLDAAYSDRTLVTRIGPLHADRAAERIVSGMPTSSSTLPGLVVTMFRHAMLADDSDTLCITGSGYGTALLARRLGEQHVTSVDVDPYLVKVATGRLDAIGLHPQTAVCDITGELPGRFDRIVATVSVPGIPASWLAALRPGGRLVTTLANTGLIITADRSEDGGAAGRVEWDRAGFMAARHGDDYPDQGLGALFAAVRDQDGEEITTGRYPVLNVRESWDIWSMLALACPGIECRYAQDDGRRRTAWLLHPDGSWARATGVWDEPPDVHQGGPQRLWSELERIRRRLNLEGGLPVYGARVRIDPDGTCHLSRGQWQATIT